MRGADSSFMGAAGDLFDWKNSEIFTRKEKYKIFATRKFEAREI